MSAGARIPRALGGLAAGAPVPVFVARGLGAGAVDIRLRRAATIAAVDSPRGATVLVVAGRIADSMAAALDGVHDQLAHPRATVWWTGGGETQIAARWPDATIVGPDGDLEAAVVAVHRDLLAGRRASEPPRLADVEPAEWRGVGPYGQGGSGMTGGVPYGRPMAGRGDDRDGLTLDVVAIGVGPFLAGFPAGLALRVTLAGDVVQALDAGGQATADDPGIGEPLPDDARAPYTALASGASGPVPIAELELARARSHLRAVSRLLHLRGLDALARRVARLTGPDRIPAAGEVAGLRRALERPWRLAWTTAGVGVVRDADAAAWGGPVARAAGLADDARAASPSYAGLGFEVVTGTAGDVADRWRQWLGEAAQALELAARAGARAVEPGEPLEWPAPRWPVARGELLARALVGAEWGDALTTLASFDLDGTAAPMPQPA